MAKNHWFKLTILTVFLGLFQGCTAGGFGGSSGGPAPSPSVPNGVSATEKIQTDRSQTTFVLPNGLDVLVVSSPKFTKASAAMAVPVGSWADPEEHQGLAHFLEHMLFLGTKEYPDAGEYTAVIAKNGGYSNAYTARTFTNYFFEVNSEALPEVLRRFSRFFVSPTLDSKYIDKEKNAVHSEFDKNIRSDGWRFWQMFGLTEPEGHPARKFNIGSRTTLKNASSAVLREFYEKHYSSDTMKLVVLGPQSAAELRSMVESNFPDVPNRELKKKPSDLLVPKSQAGKWLDIKSIGNRDTLTILFPSSGYDLHWQSKPGAILGGLVGSENPGSLASILKRKQWITSLSAGSQDLAEGVDAGYFNIGLELTEKGRSEQVEVLKTVFSVLGEIQKQGVKNYLFTEKQTMARLAFENRGLVDGADEAARIAALMLVHPALEVDERSSLYFSSDDELMTKFLKTLTPSNATVMTQSPGARTDKIEPFYGTEYSMKEIPKETKQEWEVAMATSVSDYKYPAVNPWIPTSFIIHKTEAAPVPRLLGEPKDGPLWFKQESGPDTKPMAFATFNIWTPEIARNSRTVLLAQIYEKAFGITQTERLAPMFEAGYGVSIDLKSGFVQVKVQGYSEKFSDVLFDILASPVNRLDSISITEDDLVKIKGDLKKEFADHKVKSAIDRTVARKRALMFSPSFEVEDYEPFLDEITVSEFDAFVKTLFSRIHVGGLVYGNLQANSLEELMPRIVSNLKAERLSDEEVKAIVPKENIIKPSQKFVSVMEGADNNNGMIVQLETGLRNPTNVALNMVLGTLLQGRYYSEMRTNQQLGYIVQGGASTTPAATRLDFYIQSSDYQPEELSKRTAAFLATLLVEIDTLLEQQFVTVRDGLILELSRKPSVMAERFQSLENLWGNRDAEWTYDENLIEALRTIKKEDVKIHAVKALTPVSQARLSIYYYGSKSTMPKDFGGDIPVPNVRNFPKMLLFTK